MHELPSRAKQATELESKRKLVLAGRQVPVSLGPVLGSGVAASVLQVEVLHKQVAMKVFGSLDRDAERSKHEEAVYKQLLTEQGNCIPHLIASRVLMGSPQHAGYFLVCTLLSGPPFSPVEHGRAAVAALQRIHSNKVLHGDIKLTNLMVHCGNVFFIDFERSKRNVSDQQYILEIEKLHQLLGIPLPAKLEMSSQSSDEM